MYNDKFRRTEHYRTWNSLKGIQYSNNHQVYKDNLYIDLRTVREEEFDIIVDGLLFGLNKVKGCIIWNIL